MIESNNPQQSSPKSRFYTVLRWLAFLPAAILAAVVAQLLSNIVNTFLINYYAPYTSIEPLLSLGKIWIILISNIISGIVFVYVGSFVAPAQKRSIAITLAILLAASLINLLSPQYWNQSFFILLGLAIGGVSMAVFIYKGKIQV